MKGHRQIVFIEDLDPTSTAKIVWYKHGPFKALGVNLHDPDDAAPPSLPDAGPGGISQTSLKQGGA